MMTLEISNAFNCLSELHLAIKQYGKEQLAPLGNFYSQPSGLHHKHVGSLHAADSAMAIENARDVYTRRSEGVSIWVVESQHITASNPSEGEALFDPANDKVYRHPTFYDLPEGLEHM